MIKRIYTSALKVILTAAVFLMSIYGYLLAQNNKEALLPPLHQYQASYDRAVSWALNNKREILSINNPILWWFLNESAKNTENTEIEGLVDEYLNTIMPSESIWRYYFDASYHISVDVVTLLPLPAYNLHFVYGLTCLEELREMDIIQKQLEPDFCRWSPIVSSCTTHQLMGMHFMKERKCGDANEVDRVMSDLYDQIERQLVLDPRVGDVYIQRAMMLMATGQVERVKPIWINLILNAQSDDGSWESFHPLFPVGRTQYLGFGYTFPDIRKYTPSFHTTAQAIYFISLLIKEHKASNFDIKRDGKETL